MLNTDPKFLKQISVPVDFSDMGYKADIAAIKKFCDDKECFGLAGVQIGIPKRIIYFKTADPYNPSKAAPEILMNPTLVSRCGYTKYWEACFSTGDYISLVSRPYKLVLDYYDIDANLKRKTFTGMAATVISHELDHLDGIEHIDIAESILRMKKPDRELWRKENPYLIISETCDFEPVRRIQLHRHKISANRIK